MLLIVAGLVLLGLAAARFGHDSREPVHGAPWHTWRDSLVLPSPVGVEPEAAWRLDALRASAARERLLHPRPVGRPSAPALGRHRAAAAWVGAALVRAGERLQDYGRAAAPGW